MMCILDTITSDNIKVNYDKSGPGMLQNNHVISYWLEHCLEGSPSVKKKGVVGIIKFAGIKRFKKTLTNIEENKAYFILTSKEKICSEWPRVTRVQRK